MKGDGRDHGQGIDHFAAACAVDLTLVRGGLVIAHLKRAGKAVVLLMNRNHHGALHSPYVVEAGAAGCDGGHEFLLGGAASRCLVG